MTLVREHRANDVCDTLICTYGDSLLCIWRSKMKKITENNYMTVYSNLKINTCVQEENKLQIGRAHV